MDEREILLNYIENTDLMYLSQFLLSFESVIQQWEVHQHNKQVGEPKPGSAEEAILRALTGQKLSKEEEESLKASYEVAKVRYQLLENDEEVINALASRIYQIDYDEKSEEIRAEIVCSIASLLKIKLSLYQDNSWKSVQEAIANTLGAMTPRDFLTTFELTGRNYIFRNELYNDVLIEQISDMTEPEFLRCLYDTSDGMGGGYANTKLAKKQKVREGSAGLAAKYLRLCEDPEEALEIIEKAEPNGCDILDIIMEIEKFGNNSKMEAKISELTKKLSTRQIVKYLILRVNVITFSNKVENMILDRLEDLSNRELVTLLMAYEHTSHKEEVRERIVQVAVKKGILIPQKNNKYYINYNVDDDEISKRIALYRETVSPITDLCTSFCSKNPLENSETTFDDNGVLASEETSEKILDRFRADNFDIDTREGMISYISGLQSVGDLNIIQLMKTLNKEIQNEQSDTYVLDKEKEVLKQEVTKSLYTYIKNRILNMRGPKAITLLSMAYSEDGIFNDAIDECINQFNEDIKNIKKDSDENPGSSDPRA